MASRMAAEGGPLPRMRILTRLFGCKPMSGVAFLVSISGTERCRSFVLLASKFDRPACTGSEEADISRLR